MQRFENIWMRIAVVRKHDASDRDPPLWRFFPHRRDPDLHLRSWTMTGQAAPGKNPLPGSTPEPDRDASGVDGLKAWIDLYGDVEIDDALVAHVTLKDPS